MITPNTGNGRTRHSHPASPRRLGQLRWWGECASDRNDPEIMRPPATIPAKAFLKKTSPWGLACVVRLSMVLVLVVGDLLVPYRAASVPKKFRDMLVPGKISQTLCTGNLVTREVYDWLRTVTADIHVVAGDLDESADFPVSKTVTIGAFRIGLAHGHTVVPWGDREALAILQRKLDCDVLITGHTHQFAAYAYQGAFFLNPGSATGAYSALGSNSVPTFVLMDVDERTITSYVYSLVDDEVQVEKIEYTKP